MAGSAGITGSQMTLTNWAAGGDPSVAADFQFNYSIDYQKDNSLWQNRLELAYGLNRTESNGTRKTNDKIYFSSSYGQKVHDGLYVSALVKFNTQFANGFDYAVKNDNGSYKQTSGFTKALSEELAPAEVETMFMNGNFSAMIPSIWRA
ncbi:MAG: DUF3078 domain-containing protein, partial [Tidjanibacter sp.]|nr:DUF3078 domain-containing protein [Tidjanibacter sp.]